MIDPPAWRGLARVSQVEVAIAAVTMAGVITVGVLRALLRLSPGRRRGTPRATRTTPLGWVERLTAMPMSGCTDGHIVPGVLSTGSMIACSSRTRTMSKVAFRRPSRSIASSQSRAQLRKAISAPTAWS